MNGATPQADGPEILLAGERFVAVDKPAGWLSVPSRWGDRDERRCVGRELEASWGRLWPVHRLDEEASGLLLFARDARAHALLNGLFESRAVRKRYEAWTEIPAAVPAPFTATWRSRLLRGKRRAHESPHGKPAETVATLLGTVRSASGEALAWELRPVTGRAHQLRYELSRHGYPILGDALYGAAAQRGGVIALRCVELAFPESVAEIGMPRTLTASPLADWMQRTGAPS